MKFITDADSYLGGDSKTWKNWQSKYKQPRTCEPCEDKHGTIYPYQSRLRIPEHLHCRCIILPMRTKRVGTATKEGWNGADAWLMCRGKLPDKTGRIWYEADFDYSDETRGSNRILYSNDGLIFVSYDHANTFYELIK